MKHLPIFVAVLVCALAIAANAQNNDNRIFNWIRDQYSGRLEWCLDHPKTTILASLLIFAFSGVLESGRSSFDLVEHGVGLAGIEVGAPVRVCHIPTAVGDSAR